MYSFITDQARMSVFDLAGRSEKIYECMSEHAGSEDKRGHYFKENLNSYK